MDRHTAPKFIMDLKETQFADEETIHKHVKLFKDNFMEFFRYKWRKYNKLLAKLNRMEEKKREAVVSGETPRVTGVTDDADGHVERHDEGQAEEPVTTAAEKAEDKHVDDDTTTGEQSANGDDSYVDTFLLTLRRKKVRRVISSSHDLSEDLLYAMVEEAAVELSIAYEYQLSMLNGQPQVERVARYAVQCIIASLQSRDSTFDSEALVAAVIDASPGNMTLKRTKLKTRIPCLNGVMKDRVFWTVHGFFHKPGLRLLKGSTQVDRENREFDHCGCFSPWGSKCVPEVYGFRGPLCFRCNGSDQWEMVYNDKASIHKFRMTKGNPQTHFDADREFHKTYKPCFISSHEIVETIQIDDPQ